MSKSRTVPRHGIIICGIAPDHPIPPMSEAPKACPGCGSEDMEPGFGLMGGGYGAYLACNNCSRVVAKDQEDLTGETP